ncbi:MAG: twin-arginine translocase TatA/TatE family subunit [Myxococcota bacterium]
MPRGPELLLILAALLLLFGATRLPQLGASLGSAIRNFKKGFAGEETPEEQAKAGADKKLAGTSTVEKAEEAKSKNA